MPGFSSHPWWSFWGRLRPENPQLSLVEFSGGRSAGREELAAGVKRRESKMRSPFPTLLRVVFRMFAYVAETKMRVLAARLAAAAVLVAVPVRAGVLISLSAADYQAAAAPESLVAAFGTNLAFGTASATVTPYPESLGGTTVTVVDSAGIARNAGILFVSPCQVNYQVPSGTSSGTATITIRNANGESSQGPLVVSKVAPGLFAANWNGKGPAAADAFGAISGVRTPLSMFQFDQDYSRFLTTPLNIAASAGGVTLTVYGTGIRGATTVTAKLGSQSVPVLAAHAYAGCPGLDQVDVQIPPNLANRGIAALQLTADGVLSNAVTIETLHYQYLNLGFESSAPSGGLSYWSAYGPGYGFQIDSSIRHSGNRSLRISNSTAVSPAYAYALERLPPENGLDAAKGKHLKFGAWVKTANMTRGFAGLWLSIYGPSGTLSTDNAQCATGTSDWQYCEIDRTVDPAATGGYFGDLQTGDGTAWFDDHRIEIDGAVFPECPPLGAPAGEQVSWLRNTANAFAQGDGGECRMGFAAESRSENAGIGAQRAHPEG